MLLSKYSYLPPISRTLVEASLIVFGFDSMALDLRVPSRFRSEAFTSFAELDAEEKRGGNRGEEAIERDISEQLLVKSDGEVEEVGLRLGFGLGSVLKERNG